ncbi:31062_t:CDS:2, partial [Racocetra persica]
MKEKYKNYSANLKLESINYAKKMNNHAVAQKFNINYMQCGISNTLDDDEIKYDIVLENRNKENKEIIATARIHNTKVTDRNYLIGINEKE